MLEQWTRQFGDYLWAVDHASRSYWQQFFIRMGRIIYSLASDVATGDITLRAMSLVFTTLLAIVPLLAVSFSVLKGFGVSNQLESYMVPLLEPLGEKGVEISSQIIGFVENIKVGVLGAVGLALLFYSAFSLIQKVDQAFNVMWRLKKSRSLFRRFSDYLSALLVGPVLIFASLSISASLMSSDIVQYILAAEPFGSLYRNLARLIPYLLIAIAFTFFYMFIPNTRVKLKPALLGGFISGVIWQFSSWLFASFVVSSTKYTAIYSGFAIMLFFMIWVYLNWLILLLGARLVYYLQYPKQLLLPKHRLVLSIADKEHIALRILCGVGQAFYAGHKGATTEELNAQVKLPGDLLDEVLGLLKSCDLISECLEREETYLPARPFDVTSVKDALDLIRHVPAAKYQAVEAGAMWAKLNELNREVDQQLQSTLGGITLKQLAMTENSSN